MTEQGTIPTAQAAYEAAKADLTAAFDRMNVALDREASRRALEAFCIMTEQSLTIQQPAPATGKAAKGWKLKLPTHGLDEKPIASKRKGKRADLSVLRDAMIAHVKKHPGQGAQEIRKAIGAKQSQMPTLRVLTSHAVKTKGVRRSMTYWPRGGK